MDCAQATGRIRKRKAENQDNDRLSKRLSLLNLGLYSSSPGSYHLQLRAPAYLSPERNGQKLYVPVERPPTPPKPKSSPRQQPAQDDDTMHLDDTKHKVYIYDLDAELSDSESSDDGKLIFLPDIQKHLRETRIPPSVMANSEGELAGQKQLVLYTVPSSLSVPEEKDSVRKAIIEARARARAKTGEDHDRRMLQVNRLTDQQFDARDGYTRMANGNPSLGDIMGDSQRGGILLDMASAPLVEETSIDDLDAMDLG